MSYIKNNFPKMFVVQGSDKKIKYATDTAGNGTLNTAKWTEATNSTTEITLTELLASAIPENEDTYVYMKTGEYVTTTSIRIDRKVKVYGSFSGTEKNIGERDLSDMEQLTAIDGTSIAVDSQQALDSLIYINRHASYNDGGTDAQLPVTIDGLKIANCKSDSYYGAGVRIEGGKVKVANCFM